MKVNWRNIASDISAYYYTYFHSTTCEFHSKEKLKKNRELKGAGQRYYI